MKPTNIQKIISNHNFGLNTHIGRYSYDIQYDPMAGCWRIIRCLTKYLKGRNTIESIANTNWEWWERIPSDMVTLIKR